MPLPAFLRRWRFIGGGRRPWSKGYLEARDACAAAAIDAALQRGRFRPEAGYGRGFDERVVEYPWFFEALPSGPLRLLDAGSTLNHAFVVERLPLARLKLTISTLAPEANCFWRRGISYAFEDLRHLAYRDGQFDAVACLSTLEHIGMDNTLLYTGDPAKREQALRDYLAAIREFQRVLAPGGCLLLSMPYGREQVAPWFQQFTAAMIEECCAAFGPATVERRFFRYSQAGWAEAAQADCDAAVYFDVHDAHAAWRPGDPAAAGAVVCLKLVKNGVA